MKVLSDFYYKYCSIKSTGLINCTGFLLRVLVLGSPKVLTAKRTVSIKSTGLINCTGILSCLLYFSLSKSNLIDIFLILSKISTLTFSKSVIWTFFTQINSKRWVISLNYLHFMYWFSIKSTGLRNFHCHVCLAYCFY